MSGFHEFQGGNAALAKQALPAPHNDGIDEEVILIDEVRLEQRLCQRAAAEDQDVLTRLLLQPGDLLRDVRPCPTPGRP
jgi:hypothetical protein